MNSNIWFILAGILWSIELIPQIYRILRTKKVDDISLFFFSFCFLAYISFLIGSIIMKNNALIFSHIVPFINVSIILVLLIKYRKKNVK